MTTRLCSLRRSEARGGFAPRAFLFLGLVALVACSSSDPTSTSAGGEVRITTSTTGEDLDPDGYTVVADGEERREIGVNDTLVASSVPAGRIVFELEGVASNCAVDGANSRTVQVADGETTETGFDVVCTPRTGTLEVTASTGGEDVDPDGYTVAVDGGDPRDLAPNGTVTFEGLSPGTRRVELAGVAENCTVEGENPRDVEVPGGETAATTFSVTCATRTGTLEVRASTTGDDPDPDGYTVTVDGGEPRSLAPGGSVTFSGIPEGTRAVELGDVAGNCSVDGANPRDVDVAAGETTTVTFSVACVPREGDLEVRVSTTGEDVDPDGYTVTVDGTRSRAVDRNGSVLFEDVAEGTRTVELEGVADNCAVEGENPRQVEVAFGETTATGFSVTCRPRVGDLEVRVSTTGEDVDPDGYTVVVDGSLARSVGANGSVTFEDLSEGPHEVELQGLEANCAVDGENPRQVEVAFGETAATGFSVTCRPRVGDLVVEVSTTGRRFLDPDGYTVTVDGGARSQRVDVDDTVRFADLDAGSHTVELEGVSSFCRVEGDNPRQVDVPFGGEASTTFRVRCGFTDDDDDDDDDEDG